MRKPRNFNLKCNSRQKKNLSEQGKVITGYNLVMNYIYIIMVIRMNIGLATLCYIYTVFGRLGDWKVWLHVASKEKGN